MSWRRRDIMTILKSQHKHDSRHLLYRYRPFNESFLKEIGITLPEIRHSIREVEFLEFEQNSEDLGMSKLVESLVRSGRMVFIRTPFYAFVQESLNIPSKHITVLCMAKLRRREKVFS